MEISIFRLVFNEEFFVAFATQNMKKAILLSKESLMYLFSCLSMSLAPMSNICSRHFWKLPSSTNFAVAFRVNDGKYQSMSPTPTVANSRHLKTLPIKNLRLNDTMKILNYNSIRECHKHSRMSPCQQEGLL